MIYEIYNTTCVEPLFGDWKETIIWSCVQGVMGHIYADARENPASAMAVLGDFCFLAGEPDSALVSFKPAQCNQTFIIAVPQNEQWADEIERHYGARAKKFTRYAMKKEQDVFDRRKLEVIAGGLSREYEMQMMDEQAFLYCGGEAWCRDLVSNFCDYRMYQSLGIGVIIMMDGLIVSGASSYSAYRGGIEIEIDTKEEYRRRGLALACGAKLILECLDRGLYPSWDAHNRCSAALAEKLGYRLDYAYDAYEIQW